MRVGNLTYSILAEGRIDRPHLSPNGTAVAWTQEIEGQKDVFVRHADHGVRQQTRTPENEGFALVSDDATTVAFTRRSPQNIWQLHIQRENQSGVLDDGGHHVQSAALSADGQQVAWERYGQVRRADTSTVLFHGDHQARQLKPQLSGDGQTLLFQVSDLDSAESHLVVQNAAGDISAEIENNTDAPTALSYDGSKIVYPTTDEQGFHDLSMLDLSSGHTLIISNEPNADEAQPSVAANGDVVFQLTRYDDKAQPVRSLILRNSQGLQELVPADPEWEPSLPQLSADGHTLLWLATSKTDPNQRQIRTAHL